MKPCDSISVTMAGYGANGGVGLVDKCFASIALGVEQSIEGEGFLTSPEKAERHCTARKLITTAIGSGPLYDITIDGDIEPEHKVFIDDPETDVEAVIKRTGRIEKPELLRAKLGDEKFWFSPSLADPNYSKGTDIWLHHDPSFKGASYASHRVLQVVQEGKFVYILADLVQDFGSSVRKIKIFKFEVAEGNNEPQSLSISPTYFYPIEVCSNDERHGASFHSFDRYVIAKIEVSNGHILYSGPATDKNGNYRSEWYKLYHEGNEVDDQGNLIVESSFKEDVNFEQDVVEPLEAQRIVQGNQRFGGGISISAKNAVATSEMMVIVTDRNWSGGQFPSFKGRVRVYYSSEGSDTWSAKGVFQAGGAYPSLNRLNNFGEKVKVHYDKEENTYILAILKILKSASTEACRPFIDVYKWFPDITQFNPTHSKESFRFDPFEQTTRVGANIGQFFDLAITDGRIAFSATDPIEDIKKDKRSELRSGKVEVFTKNGTDYVGAYIDPDYITPDNTRLITSFDGPSQLVEFGRSIKFTEDGRKILVSASKHVAIYEYEDENPSIGQGSSNITIGDDDVAGLDPIELDVTERPGTISFSSSDYYCSESDPFVEVTIVRGDGVEGRVSVDYETVSGSATENVDFVASAGSVTFEDGENSKTIRITILQDSEIEGSENFNIVLSNARYEQDSISPYFVVGNVAAEPRWEKRFHIDSEYDPAISYYTNDINQGTNPDKFNRYEFPITSASIGTFTDRANGDNKTKYIVPIIKANSYGTSSPIGNSQIAIYLTEEEGQLTRFDQDILKRSQIYWRSGFITNKNQLYRRRSGLYPAQPIHPTVLGDYRFISWSSHVGENSSDMSDQIFLATGDDLDIYDKFSMSFNFSGEILPTTVYPYIITLGGQGGGGQEFYRLRFLIGIESFTQRQYVLIDLNNTRYLFYIKDLKQPYVLSLPPEEIFNAGIGKADITSLDDYNSPWTHFAITIDKTSEFPSIKLYQDGLLIGTQRLRGAYRNGLDQYKQLSFKTIGSIAGDNNTGYDDIRIFDRVLEPDEVGLLASHKTRAFIDRTFKYEYLGNKDGVISLEYKSSNFKDVPIASFCEKRLLFPGADIRPSGGLEGCDYGRTPDTYGCVIDAEIEFCYSTRFPDIQPIYPLYSTSISGTAFLEGNSPPHLQLTSDHSKDLEGIGRLFNAGIFGYTISSNMSGVSSLRTGYVDKYNGSFFDLSCAQKLYPSSDVNVSNFISSEGTLTNLFEYIDEGVDDGDWRSGDTLVSDDAVSYIQLVAPDTKGNFSYKAGITNTLFDPEESIIKFRMSGPLKTLDSDIPPRYTITNIRFEDPDGILISEYEDIEFTGDSDFENDINYTTVVRKEKINNVKGRYRWSKNYPTLDSGNAPAGFTLSFDIIAEELGGEFTYGFTHAFKEDSTPRTSQLNDALRISAIEICASGRPSNYQEDFINLMTPVVDTGRRIEKCFYPTFFPKQDFDTGVWPSVSSIWSANGYANLTNESTSGTIELLNSIRDIEDTKYATLDSMGPVEDSGKLTLRFGYSVAEQREIQAGPFSDAFGEGRNKRSNIWFSPPGAFAGLTTTLQDIDENFFEFESILLKVRAKKAIGSRDYSLDVVGYSDDCLINVTPAVGGFLQNTSGVYLPDHSTDTLVFYGNDGSIPTTSGFRDVDDLGLSAETFSDKSQYYETNLTNNAGGDHYLLSTYPVVSSTDFEWYEIPLKVYEDNVDIGRSKKYNVSSLLERLYLDIYPLPTGATISNIQLCVRYAPQNAINLMTQGGAGKIDRSQSSFFTTYRRDNDTIINAGSGYGPLSLIEDIPHGFDTPNSLKSNYSRRWRGLEGTVNGPFDVDQFSFAFENPLLDYPFVSGFYLFEDNSTTITPVVGNLQGSLITSYDNYHFNNIGWRFSNSGLFNDRWPTFSTNYTTTDWTALEDGSNNFQDHELYGQIADAFSNVVRISGQNSYINFENINLGVQGENGLSVFLRFTPDANVSGADYNMFESGVLVSKWDAGQDLEFCLAYSGGYLTARATDAISSNVIEIYDTVPYSGYQFPLSVILTYNDHESQRMKLYTDNEFEADWNVLRATSNPFYLSVGNSDLKVGHSPGSGVGFNMFVSELGISKGNIVESNPDFTYQEVTAETFLDNHRVHWWDAGDSASSDRYKLWDYLDEDVFNEWRLGEFNYCHFNPDFDCLGSTRGQRSGKDLIKFYLSHHGSGYSQYLDRQMPTTVDSGVSYHTQIENDFLRFNISDTRENFHSIYPRVSKNLPHGYNFAEKALYVGTIYEHKSESHNIKWEDGNIGPKLIVSLYTKSKEPVHPTIEPFTEPNWGLINRSIHYLAPSSCISLLESKFTYGDYCDKTEEWALFPHEPRLSEFNEKYYSTDVDDMFLQYDLVYPSGPAFDSRLDIHSCTIKAENNFAKPVGVSGTMLLTTSGNPSPVENNLEMYLISASGMEEIGLIPSSGMNLYTAGPITIEEDRFILFTSGEPIRTANLVNFIQGHDVLSSSGLHLIASGDGRTWTQFPPPAVGGMMLESEFVAGASPTLPPLPMFVFGKGLESGILPLSFGDVESSINPDGQTLPLYTFAASGASGVQDFMPIYLLQNYKSSTGADSGVLDLLMFGSLPLGSRFVENSMNLSLRSPDAPPPAERMNLSLKAPSLLEAVDSDTLNLTLLTYGFNIPYFLWYNNDYGVSILQQDNKIASVPIDDEIRGVDLYGYGSCTGNSPQKAIDPAVIIDDTVWYPERCYEGGIFRATSTYTNLEEGYEANYYGIRKYQYLVPDGAYKTSITIKTGYTEPIKLPNDWEEWEYGTCGPDTIGDCCPDDACTRNINFSGIKLIGDYPYLSGDPQITEPDGRKAGDKYGYSVAVKKDLMAVGAPYHEFENEEGNNMHKAGAVFLYRRNEDIPGLKAEWELQDKIVLPSGFRGDYVSRTYAEFIKYDDFSISGQQWNIGMEGREFGHCVDLASSGDRETLVVGAPGAYWNRQFRDITVSGIPVFMMVFTDKFAYEKDKIRSIGVTSLKYDTLYKYFSAPWVFGGSEFQPELNINLLVCQVHDADQIDELPPVRSPYPWFKHVYINNIKDDVDTEENLISQGLEGVKAKFSEFFPHGDALYSGIPPIVGVFGDNTASSAGGFEPIIDQFLKFYQDYAYASGVKDLTNDTAQSGYIKQIYGNSFGWNNDTINLLDKTLATGNLLSAKQVRFPDYKIGGNPIMNYLSSGIGQQYAIQDAYEFQVPPESGGRVYIFEKEGGKFNLVQEIVSPEEEIITQTDNPAQSSASEGGETIISPYRPKPNDRFGHAVAISNNSEVVAIGSPYSTETCMIYERDESENTRMYEKVKHWLTENNKTELVDRYDLLATASGLYEVQKQVYLEMTQSDKFLFRSDTSFWGATPINLYKKIYKYDNTDIRYVGTWRFIPQETAPTSRLGYSAAVSEDGGIVAFGAPTDSFNEFEDTNVYYRQEDTWASYAQAGAVRVFESRKTYNHNKAVEYTRFGNLDRSVHATGDMLQHYNSMSGIFAVDNVPFERLPFEEIEIPQDAGLAFIITPEIDATSDEIVDNIKSWLALGDRTLVLVGNDPVFEEDGLYSESNEILNKLLKKLDSRMTLVPARNQYESLVDGVTEERYDQNKYNVVKSFVPEYTHETHIQAPSMFASGVADIKIDLSDLGMEDFFAYAPCGEDNPICGLPLKHLGDLRAEWDSKCIIIGDPPQTVEYKTNWGFHFNNDNPAMQCSFWPQFPKPEIDRPNEEIRPILVAAGYVQPPPRIIAAQSGVDTKCEYILSGIKETKITNNTITYDFADNQLEEVAFSIGESASDLITGNYNSFNIGTFSNPSKVQSRNAIMQGIGTSWFEDVPPDLVVVEEESVWATEEQYFDGIVATSSKVIIMSSLQAETDFALGKGEIDQDPNNEDQNIFFYNNLVMRDCSNAGNIIQLGGWTGRESFKDASKDSGLAKVFTQYGHTLSMNVSYPVGTPIPTIHNVAWVANPLDVPSDEDIKVIKNWLRTGDKKLIMTYTPEQNIAGNIDYICKKLGLNTAPYYSSPRNQYYVQDRTQLITNGNQQDIPYDTENPDFEIIQKLDNDADVFVGCPKGQKFNQLSAFNTKVEKLAIIAEGSNTKTFEPPFDPDNNYDEIAFVPLKVGANTRELVKYKIPIFEYKYNNPHEYWKIDSKGSVDFPVQAGSGYRIFMNYVSETENEKYDITFDDVGIYYNANPPGQGEEESRSPIDKKFKLTTPGKTKTLTLDFRAKSGTDVATFLFNTDEWKKIPSEDLNGNRPITPRILSISGCLLPIEETRETTTRIKKEKIYIKKCVEEPWFIPEQIIQQPERFGPIATLNDKYCNPLDEFCEDGGGKYVEDGPVVVADEYEHFTTFDVGRRRSRIVLVSDSTMIQGQVPYYRRDALDENQLFIRSLYPPSPDNNSAFGLSDEYRSTVGLRKFSFAQKVIAPQRGSAAKYYAASGLDGLVSRYSLGGVTGNLQYYTDQENNQNPGDVFRELTPPTKAEREIATELFGQLSSAKYGVHPKYSGIIDGVLYVDAPIEGGVPDFMLAYGKDYIDFEMLASGYAGDLFGYSIDIHEDKLIVGTPFQGFLNEKIDSWSGIYNMHESGGIGSGLQLSSEGGAGAAFYYERTGRGKNAVTEFLPWEFKQKIRPSSINVGIDDCTLVELENQRAHEPVSLTSDFVLKNASRTDRFGHSVAIDADFAVIGAPMHDFESIHQHIYGPESAFIRKEFGTAFDIPKHKFFDLGSSGVRVDDFGRDSGKFVLNNGAAYTYRNKMLNWSSRSKEWVFAQKMNAEGYGDRNNVDTTGCENDHFGFSVAVDRARRGDSDYVMVAGSPNHNYPTSGEHPTQTLEDAGSAYTFDAMLREQGLALPNSGSYIDAKVFGHKPESEADMIRNVVYQNASGDIQTHVVTGIVFADSYGNIFLEVSGQDKSEKSFVPHRPYVESIEGVLIEGTENNDFVNFITEGTPNIASGQSMSLSIPGPSSDIVYNNMSLSTYGAYVASGDLPMYLQTYSGVMDNYLNLNMTTNQTTGNLNLRIRGK